MTLEIGIMLALMAAALVLFVRESLPIEVTALALLAAVVVIGLLPPERALAGFSNRAVVAIGGLFVLSRALVKTGLLELFADWLSRRLGRRPWLAIGVLLMTVGLLSGFLNNTAIVAIFIPLVMSLCARFELSPSKVLIPLSYVAIVGGTLTLIGTSTNLLVSALVEDAGQRPIGMFELSRLGLIFLGLGLGYALLFARRGLPARAAAGGLASKYRMGSYLAEVVVEPGSALIGTTLLETRLNEEHGVTALAVIRGDQRVIEQIATLPLSAGDVLLIQGAADDLLNLRSRLDLSPAGEQRISDEELNRGGLHVVEGLVGPDSTMIGRSLAEIDFRHLFGGFVMAIRRSGGTLRDHLTDARLAFADSLLMLVPAERLDELQRSEDLVVVSESHVELRRSRLWWLVLPLLPLVVAAAALEVVDIAVGALIGCVVLLVCGTVTPKEAYRAIDWSVIFMIAAFVPVGTAVLDTGTAAFLARGLTLATGWLPEAAAPYGAVALVYLITSSMTQMISNNAAAIIMTPIALGAAASLGIDARPLVIAVCFAASAEFMTPMGYQTNLMVYGPGAYRFLDYTRFGAPLNLLFWLLASLLIPVFWPF